MPPPKEPFYIIGHRGAAGERLENTLDGFRHALTLAIDAIEIDIREHSQRLWVIHDHDLERLTGTPGWFEDQPDPAAIELHNGELVPDLQQLLDLYWGKMPINIEIKSLASPQLLLDILAGYPAPGASSALPWILISSFNHAVLLELRKLNCPWPLAPINSGISLQLDAELQQIAPFSWHFDNEYLDFAQIRYLRDQGVPSLVYTVNDLQRAQFLRRSGVAGIITDFPSRMIEQLR